MKKLSRKIRLFNRKIRENTPPGIYTPLRFVYRLLYENIRNVGKPVGFISSVKIDFRRFFLKKNSLIRVDNFKVFGDESLMVFNEKNGYEILKGNDHVLDLGGYIGDSPLILSKNNMKISVYEPDKDSFRLLARNIELNDLAKRVTCFNYAVIQGDEKRRKFFFEPKSKDRSSTHYSSTLIEKKVDCAHIKNILRKKFDAIKCDIEGGEWEIIDWFIRNPSKFDFKEGIFELHYSKNLNEVKNTKKFLHFLKKKGYSYYFYDPPTMNKIPSEKILSIKKTDMGEGFKGFMFYFYKN